MKSGFQRLDHFVDQRGRSVQRHWPAESSAGREIGKAWRRSIFATNLLAALLCAVLQMALLAGLAVAVVSGWLERKSVEPVAAVLYGAVFVGFALWSSKRVAPRGLAFYADAGLRRGLCPACLAELSAKPASDGCVPCPRCGAAWRLPAADVTSRG